MFEFETAMSRPSAHELQRQARREQARLLNTKLADLLGGLAHRGAQLTRAFAAEWRLRRDIRTLRQFGDRTLQDMGLTRGEIEHVVRNGRRWHAMDWAGYAAPRPWPASGPAKQ